MATFTVLVLIVALLEVTNCDSDGLICYQCDKVAHGLDCNQIAKCGPHEVCSNERYITHSGIVYYKSGCKGKSFCPNLSTGRRRSDISDCMTCCTQDYCNKDLCDYPKVTELDNRCLKCDDVDHPSMCTDVTRCGLDQTCFTLKHFDFGFNAPRFVLGCRDKRQCGNNPVGLFGRDTEKRSTTICNGCCNGENCNRNLCNGTTHSVATLTTASQMSLMAGSSTTSTNNPSTTPQRTPPKTTLKTTRSTNPTTAAFTAPGTNVPTFVSISSSSSSAPLHVVDMPITVDSQWFGGFYGSFNLSPHHNYHGWCAHLVFDKPIHTVELKLVKACPGNKEFLAHSLSLNENLLSGSSINVAIVGRIDGNQAPAGHVYLTQSCRVCGTGHVRRASKQQEVVLVPVQDKDPNYRTHRLHNPDIGSLKYP